MDNKPSNDEKYIEQKLQQKNVMIRSRNFRRPRSIKGVVFPSVFYYSVRGFRYARQGILTEGEGLVQLTSTLR